MRERLLEATLDCLYERGYAGTTTTEVVRRAGVSRGAMLHHFPSKIDLVLAATEYVAALRLQAFRDAMSQLPQGEDLFAAALRHLWRSFTSPAFYAVLELTIAARNQAELQTRLRASAARFEADVADTIRELFAGWPSGDEALALGRNLIFFLFQGMAVSGIVRDVDADALGMMSLLEQLARLSREPSAES